MCTIITQGLFPFALTLKQILFTRGPRIVNLVSRVYYNLTVKVRWTLSANRMATEM